MQNSTERQVIDLIKRSEKVLILPSSPADGDSVGSAISMYLVLKQLGKEATVVCSDSIPDLLKFLPNANVIEDKIVSSHDFVVTVDAKNLNVEDVKTNIENGRVNIVITPKDGNLSEEDVSFNKGEIDYDLIITVDTAELKQLRSFYENNTELFSQIPVINIDHHISNAHFGKLNLVDIMSAATTQLLLPLYEQLGQEEKMDLIDEDVATLLLTGIITDTGSFQNANTTPKAFAAAAKLISYGARQQEIIQHIYKTKQLSQLKLWGRVLSKIQTDDKYKMVWSVVSQQDFKDTESTTDQTGDIIDELMTNAPGAEVIILMKEKEDGMVTASLRTTNDSIDAAKIAESFGGGGHVRAAGFGIQGMDLREAEYKVINEIRKYQSARLGLSPDEEKKAEKKIESEPMINVEALMEQAKQAEKATEMISKSKLKLKKPKSEKPETDSIYKFED